MSLRMMSRSYILRCSGSDRVLCASEISRNIFSAASFCPGPLALSGWKRSASCLRTAISYRVEILLPMQMKQDITMSSLGNGSVLCIRINVGAQEGGKSRSKD